MTPSDSTRRNAREERRLWFSILVPSLAWATAFTVSFLLASEACETGRRWILYLVTGAGLAAAAAGALEGWRSWKRLEAGRASSESNAARRRFMAVGGLILAMYFCLVLLALAIPQIVHRPCD
jgi:hypothetical protein